MTEPGNLPPPAPQPGPPPSPNGPLFAMLAMGSAVFAFVASLPVLWWRMTTTSSISWLEELFSLVTNMLQADGVPAWFIQVRAASILLSFLAIVFAVLARILGYSNRNQAITVLLALAALLVTAPLMSMIAMGGIVLLLAIAVGIGAF